MRNSQPVMSVVGAMLAAVILLQLTTVDAAPSHQIKVKRTTEQQQCPELDDEWIDRIWAAYKDKHERTYEGDEDESRQRIFFNNVLMTMRHNIEEDLGLHTWTAGLNDFADWTKEELGRLNGALEPDSDGRRKH